MHYLIELARIAAGVTILIMVFRSKLQVHPQGLTCRRSSTWSASTRSANALALLEAV